MADPLLSVIIPLWNGREFIDDCLSSLLASSAELGEETEILVVDNGSADGSAAHVAEVWGRDRVLLFPNEKNMGFAGGCNVGLRAARGRYVALLNQDTQVRPGWAAALVMALAAGAGVVGSLALLPDGVTVQHAGGVIEWPTAIARHVGYGEAAAQWRQAADVDFVTAAAMAFPRRLLDEIGLLDEMFWPGYYEDADFCYRARDAGYSVQYVPDAILVHHDHASFRDRQWTRWARLRGRLRFCLKQRSPSFFIDEFLPAEEALREATLNGDVGGGIALAYLEAIPMMVDLWGARATPAQSREAAQRLQALYAPSPFHIPGDKSGDKWIPGGDKRKLTTTIKPILSQSRLTRIPLVGGLWSALRRSLHQLVWFYVEQRQDRLAALVDEQAAQIETLQAALDDCQATRDDRRAAA
ncbi:MAG: glycosyltransferase family 2 protein [Caldilineaceae bacterium]